MKITVTGTAGEKLASYFGALSRGGQVLMPYERQAWGQELGMLIDAFGVHWMISVRAQ